jgi:hypothetical protein
VAEFDDDPRPDSMLDETYGSPSVLTVAKELIDLHAIRRKAREVVERHQHTCEIRELAQMLADYDGLVYTCPCRDPLCRPARPREPFHG